jgi:hypothetical protein
VLALRAVCKCSPASYLPLGATDNREAIKRGELVPLAASSNELRWKIVYNLDK